MRILTFNLRSGLLWGLVVLLPGLAQASSVQIDVVPHLGHCKRAIVRNLSSHTLQITVHYVVKRVDGSYFSSSESIGAVSAGFNSDWAVGGLGPGQAGEVIFHSGSCDVPQEVTTSYTTFDVDAHNERLRRNAIAEEQAEQQARQRAFQRMQENRKRQQQENEQREAQKRAEAMRLDAEEKRRKQQDYRQLMERQMESAKRDGEKTMREIQAGAARQEAERQAELQAERQRQAEMVRGQAEREAYNRDAQAKVAKAQADWQAQQAAAQRAAQAEQARQAARAAELAAQERRRQEQWQQQVNLTNSLLQGSIQNSENALAASQAKLNSIVTTYDKEDEALADIITKARAAAQNGK